MTKSMIDHKRKDWWWMSHQITNKFSGIQNSFTLLVRTFRWALMVSDTRAFAMSGLVDATSCAA
jgi:hypothetical protein